MRELKLEGGEALIIVAHPDDETIWMGGTILKFPRVYWTIVSLCRASDPDRAPRFKIACRALGAKGRIFDLEDEGLLNIRQSVPEIKKILKNHLPVKNYKYIFTHGAGGEYGHSRHKAVHQAIKEMISNRELKAENIMFFSFKLKGKFKNNNLGKKLSIIKDIYGFKKKSSEYRFGSYKPEAFSVLK